MGRKMKDSGVEWIGEIPEDWKIVSLKRLCSFEAGKTLSSNEIAPKGAYKVYGGNGLRGYYSQYNHEGDCLLVGRQGALCGNVHEVSGKFWATEHAWITTKTPLVDAGYLFELLKGMNLNQYVSNAAAQPGLSVSVVANVKTVLPPKNEQEKIANKLHNKCVVIENLIEKNKEIIETYKSLKQSLITRAVTKGVRGKREMTNSGIEWIGEIPVEWKLAQLGKFIAISSGISVGRTYPPGTELVEVPYLRVANVQGDYVDLTDIAFIKVTQDEADRYKLRAGSLLMTEGGDRDKLGRGTLWNGEIENCIHQNHVFEVCPNENLLVKFLDYITTSDVARVYFDITAKKTTNLACTNKSTILKFKLPIPSVEEQQEIIDYLDEKCTAIDTLIAKKEQLLTELEAYKKSLIYEYVTGKREIITNLLTMQYS